MAPTVPIILLTCWVGTGLPEVESVADVRPDSGVLRITEQGGLAERLETRACIVEFFALSDEAEPGSSSPEAIGEVLCDSPDGARRFQGGIASASLPRDGILEWVDSQTNHRMLASPAAGCVIRKSTT